MEGRWKDGNVVKREIREGSGKCGGERSDITKEKVGKNRLCDGKRGDEAKAGGRNKDGN